MTEVQIARSTKIALKGKPVTEVAEALVDQLPWKPTKEPKFPGHLAVSDKVTKAFREVGKLFNKVAPIEKRELEEGERAHLLAEYEYINDVLTLLAQRKENIKEYVRNHLDAQAERVLGSAAQDVPRDSQGHLLLAQAGEPATVTGPGTNAKFSNEYRNGATTAHLDRVEELRDAGEISEDTYKAITKQVRVPDEERITDYVLRTGDTDLLAKLVDKGRPTQALNLRGVSRK